MGTHPTLISLHVDFDPSSMIPAVCYREIALNVSVVNTPNTPIYNVIGKIVGSVEPG